MTMPATDPGRRRGQAGARGPRVGLLGGLSAVVLAGAIGGCGSSKTETVSVSNSTPSARIQRTARPTTPHNPSPAPPAGRSPAGTRTAPSPAFVPPAQSPEEGSALNAARATVRAHGFTVGQSSEYRADHTLRVLVGTRPSSSESRSQQAFFFVGGRYIGTDTSEPSASVDVIGQSDTEVTLAYALYRPHDPLCCPTGGRASVRFQLDNGRLVPIDPIPPAHSSTTASRQ